MRAAPADTVVIDPERFDAVIFDLDGVITDTAQHHFRAWQRLFSEFLHRRGDSSGVPEPFSFPDYERYVNGRNRADGAVAFLAARGITLPAGSAADSEDAETIAGLCQRKARYFRDELARSAPVPLPGAPQLLGALRAHGLRTGVVSASKHCRAILEAIGLAAAFDAIIDGQRIAELGLPGKPDPAAFLQAARELDAAPARSVVVEDATSGVEAGRAGGFGLVIGIGTEAQEPRLRAAGADAVVAGLDRVRTGWDAAGVADSGMNDWLLRYEGFNPGHELQREALCTLGNGYWATRGTAPEGSAGPGHYPGTYLAGCYNRLTSVIGEHVQEDESLVNAPNWLCLTFAAQDEPWFAGTQAEIIEQRYDLDLRRGLLIRQLRVRDAAQRITRVIQRRLVHIARHRLALLETTFVPENWSGILRVRSALDGAVANTGVARYRALSSRHLDPPEITWHGDDTATLVTHTTQSRIRIAMTMRTMAGPRADEVARENAVTDGAAVSCLRIPVQAGQAIEIAKIVSVATSRDAAISEPALAALRLIERAPDLARLRAEHAAEWEYLWQRFHLDLTGDCCCYLRDVRLGIFHVLQTTLAVGGGEIDAGVPARGLHGEAYRGHVFWDELLVFPALTLRLPRLTRALLAYRYRRLSAARAAAAAAGLAGAMFPWQSGSDGREETQRLHLNPVSEHWLADLTRLARHSGLAVAYNAVRYYEITGDQDYLADQGAELVLEVARFAASLAEFDDVKDRYVIRSVVGPDEFHTQYPGSGRPGIDNNAYTNVFAAWVLARAPRVLDQVHEPRRSRLVRKLEITDDELRRWDDIASRLFVPFTANGVVSQFEGYDELAELDWQRYRDKYSDISRLDRILESEGDTPNRYQVAKQADVLMLLYLFSAEELTELFARLGYEWDPAKIQETIDYYLARTSHGSTLSLLVHAWVLSRARRDSGMEFFEQALRRDRDLRLGSSAAEGIHLAAMAGCLDVLQRCFGGVSVRSGVLSVNPTWPSPWGVLEFDVTHREHQIRFRIGSEGILVRDVAGPPTEVEIDFRDVAETLRPGGQVFLHFARARQVPAPRP